MTTQFSLRNFRILTLGGAKASTNGGEDGNKKEPDQTLYFG
ncbi:hypothetical protein [Phenylobacterium sp.]